MDSFTMIFAESWIKISVSGTEGNDASLISAIKEISGSSEEHWIEISVSSTDALLISPIK